MCYTCVKHNCVFCLLIHDLDEFLQVRSEDQSLHRWIATYAQIPLNHCHCESCNKLTVFRSSIPCVIYTRRSDTNRINRPNSEGIIGVFS